MPPGHLMFQTLQQLLFQQRLLQKIAGITHTIKNTIQAITKKSQHANHAVMKIYTTCATNNDSQGIYTLRDKDDNQSKPSTEKESKSFITIPEIVNKVLTMWSSL